MTCQVEGQFLLPRIQNLLAMVPSNQACVIKVGNPSCLFTFYYTPHSAMHRLTCWEVITPSSFPLRLYTFHLISKNTKRVELAVIYFKAHIPHLFFCFYNENEKHKLLILKIMAKKVMKMSKYFSLRYRDSKQKL